MIYNFPINIDGDSKYPMGQRDFSINKSMGLSWDLNINKWEYIPDIKGIKKQYIFFGDDIMGLFYI